jgi:hypothetical protein
MMTPLQKEQRLHQIVAGSAFVFALCALPVAQQVLLRHGTQQQGAVAGISTDTSITAVDVSAPTPKIYATKADCLLDKDQQLSDLARFVAGKRQSIQEQSDAATSPYQAALSNLKGTPDQVAEETTALSGLIEQATAPYRTKLSEVESAAASQKEAIASLPCPAE